MRTRQRYGETVLAMVALALLLGGAGRAGAALIFYNSRTAFNTANSGLPVETFEAALVNPGNFATIPSPLSASTNNAVFHPGDILPGLTVSSVGAGSSDLVVTGVGTTPGATKTVGNLTFANAFELSFSPGVSAVASDLFSSTGPGILAPTTFTVSVFGAGGLLGTETLVAPLGTAFLGVSSDADLITRIDIAAGGGTSTFADNVAFGTPAAAVPVPEPSSLALLSLGGLGLAGWRRWKGKRAGDTA